MARDVYGIVIRAVFLLFFYLNVWMWGESDACILLLNGWSPVSVAERTRTADIVAAGDVMATFKKDRTPAKTYSAQIRITHVYKGHDSVSNAIPLTTSAARTNVSSAIALRNTYNVSNFGDKAHCYSEVEQGQSYIFFLTIYQSRFSAKYDDIFGAVIEHSKENEEQILEELGWDTWSAWTTCSKPCGSGIQNRTRKCSVREQMCVGEFQDTRRCNIFSCNDAGKERTEWSTWSACSATCGQGVHTRVHYCKYGFLHESCRASGIPRLEVRKCFVRECSGFCSTVCLNGGQCLLGNICHCPSGYQGQQCEIPICTNACQNGGHFSSPCHCTCVHGYTGTHCETTICKPECINGGYCTDPHKCTCPKNSRGRYCQIHVCTPSCKNGGKCVGKNKCVCRKGFKGRRCRKGCRGRCKNGGQCINNKRCKCPPGYRGRLCARKTKRRIRQPLVEQVLVPCGPWLTDSCIELRRRFMTVYHRAYRLVTRCRRRIRLSIDMRSLQDQVP